MKILVTGATGFIASQIVADLLAAGHQVTCCVRNLDYARNLFPQAKLLSCDFRKDQHSENWLPRLRDVELVINCVGILYHPNKKVIWDVHYNTPRALFDACVKTGVKRIIQISALGVDQSEVDYAKSKKAADDYLLSLPIEALILRPSFVYGRGSYGGSSLFRGLAGLPFILPVPGKGKQLFQPIHVEDLAKAVLKLLDPPLRKNLVLNAVSEKRVTLREILGQLRAWLGFSKARVLFIPLRLIRFGAFFGDWIPYSAMNSTSYKMLNQNSVTSEIETKNFHQHLGFTPRDFTNGLYSHPSSVQDRWHARLFFLKPLLQFSLAFLWLFSAICSVFLYPQTAAFDLLAQAGVSDFWQPYCLYGASILDALLGLGLLLSYQVRKICALQILLIALYSLIITWKLPVFWLEPFAPVAKNIPLIVATLVFMALESDR